MDTFCSCVPNFGEHTDPHIIPSETQKIVLIFLWAARKKDHFVRVMEGTIKYDLEILIFTVFTQTINFLRFPATAP